MTEPSESMYIPLALRQYGKNRQQEWLGRTYETPYMRHRLSPEYLDIALAEPYYAAIPEGIHAHISELELHKSIVATRKEVGKIRAELGGVISSIIEESVLEKPALEDITIFDCLIYNPRKNIEIICVVFFFLSLFFVSVSVTLGFHFINPFFAILLTVAWGGFWIMVKYGKK